MGIHLVRGHYYKITYSAQKKQRCHIQTEGATVFQMLQEENTREELSKFTSVDIGRKWLLRTEISSHLETEVLEQISRKNVLGTKQKPLISFQDSLDVFAKELFGMVSPTEIHLSTLPAVSKLGLIYRHF